MDNNEYRIVRLWDDEHGAYTYVLEIDNGEGKGWERTIYEGNGDWAFRQSMHYGASIVTIDDKGHLVNVEELDGSSTDYDV